MAKRTPPTGKAGKHAPSFVKGKKAEETEKQAHPAHNRGARSSGVAGHVGKAVEPTGGKHGHGLKQGAMKKKGK
jgi:hypothetical protein